MKSNQSLFLFGAGAAIAWKGPFTYQLTELIRKYSFPTKGGNQTITDFIYNRLKEAGYSEYDINFETIINVVEEFAIYYAPYDYNKKTPSLLKTFFNPNDLDEILNYRIPNGKAIHGYRIEIPAGSEFNYGAGALKNETPEQFFFQQLLASLLSDIAAQISEYAWHTTGHSRVITPENEKVNTAFIKFMTRLGEFNLLRMYTLNYDRIFKILLAQTGMEVFEGFDCGSEIPYDAEIRADLQRIYKDLDSNIYYNLHGSTSWEVVARDRFGLTNHEIVLSGTPSLMLNGEIAFMQVEKGKSIVVSNIITGYQKAQRSFLPPFKQMQFSFERDILNAMNMFIVGYSFGDEHINETIRTACRYNPNIKFHIVDPAYSEKDGKNGYEDRLVPVIMQVFTEFMDKRTEIKKGGDDHYIYYGGRLHVYTMGLDGFLEYYNNKSEIIALTN